MAARMRRVDRRIHLPAVDQVKAGCVSPGSARRNHASRAATMVAEIPSCHPMKKSFNAIFALLAVGGAIVLFSAGCAGTATRASTGEYIDDAAITAKVKASFIRDPIVKAFDVGVDTFKGVVQLNGFVDTLDQKNRAEQIARGTPGVQRIENRITVK